MGVACDDDDNDDEEGDEEEDEEEDEDDDLVEELVGEDEAEMMGVEMTGDGASTLLPAPTAATATAAAAAAAADDVVTVAGDDNIGTTCAGDATTVASTGHIQQAVPYARTIGIRDTGSISIDVLNPTTAFPPSITTFNEMFLRIFPNNSVNTASMLVDDLFASLRAAGLHTVRSSTKPITS